MENDCCDEYVVRYKITRNAIKCLKCGDIIESKHRHDFRVCSCGAVAVDGGHDYQRICGNREDWENLVESVRIMEGNENG